MARESRSPSSKALEALRVRDPELVIGIVSPVGANQSALIEFLEDELRSYEYDCEHIRLSLFLKRLDLTDFGIELVENPETQRIETYMDAGTALRSSTRYPDVLAISSISEIARLREDAKPRPRQAYVLDSLKHPAEVELLRAVYEDAFFLVAAYQPEANRFDNLVKDHSCSPDEATHLLTKDQFEGEPYGQQTREVFHQADVFVDLSCDGFTAQIERFLRMVFGDPTVTPTLDEHAMFLAHAASLRSADLSRQVGAAILSEGGDVIGLGANDVPAFGGGQYWPCELDARDIAQEVDSNEIIRNELVVAAVKSISKACSFTIEDLSETNLLQLGEEWLGESGFLDVTEYGRAMHAEMEALLTCARSGVSVRAGRLYSTTFPCHNCAKHIVGAGISEVIFIQPYPKSRALELHEDAIVLDDPLATGREGRRLLVTRGGSEKVRFRHFVGVSPRRFIDLFSIQGGRAISITRKRAGRLVKWTKEAAQPRFIPDITSYLEREMGVTMLLDASEGE
jgi:deoxycytidylate deaminase